MRRCTLIVLAPILVSLTAMTAQAQTPLDTSFTYQGELASEGTPAFGEYDLRFSLFEAATGASQISGTLCSDNVSISNGRFTVVLDFGPIFTGQKRFLEIAVRPDSGLGCSDSTGYTVLTPRQELTATPNANFAQSAGTATSAVTAANATSLNGQPASFFTNAANLTGTLPTASLPPSVARLDQNQTFTGLVNFTNPASMFTGAFSGNGSLLTSLNGANVQAGTLTRSRVAADIESVLSQWNQALGQPVLTPLDAVGWGASSAGQTTIPALPPGVTYTQVAGGYTHSLALRSDGTVVAWGGNFYGQTNVPALPPGVTYMQVSAGGDHNLAVRSDGTVVAWGANFSGETNVPSLPPGVTYTQVSAGGGHSLALRSDGTVVAWGANLDGQTNVPALPPGVTYTKVSAGGGHSLALRNDGTVVAWGENFSGETNVPSLPPGVTYTQVSAGGGHSLALRSDGTVVAWGDNLYGQTNVPAPPPGVTCTQISSGVYHSLALRSDGTVVAWGANFFGQTTVPALPEGVTYTQVEASDYHSLALRQQDETPSIITSTTGISVGSSTAPPPAGGIAAQSTIMVDGAAANTGTLDGALRFGSLTNGVGIASRQTSGGNQGGLDFFTEGSQRLRITSDGKVGIGVGGQPTSGKLLVFTDEANAPGLIYSTAIRARHDGLSDSPNNPFGIWGQQRGGSGFFPTGGAAVFGSSDTKHGVVGFTYGGADDFAYGVYGAALNLLGEDAVGVYGRNDGSGTAVAALSTITTGQATGLSAISRSPDSRALSVENQAFTGDAIAIRAQTSSPTGYSGYFVGDRNYFSGSVGIGLLVPLTPLHVRNTTDLGLTTAVLENDDLIVEATDATIGLYSTNSGNWGSAIAMKEMVGGALVNTWGIARQTSGGDNSLRFTYGTNHDYAANPAVLTLSAAGNATVSGSMTAASFSGSGAGLTSLNATNLTTGTLPNARLSGTYTSVVTLSNASNAFTGSGTGLTALNATNLTSGTVADARLSTNIPRLNAATNAFTGTVSVVGTVQSTAGFVFPDGNTQTSAVAPIISAAVSVDPPSLASLAGTTVAVTVPGAAVGDSVVANPGANLTVGYVLSFARVSAANTVTLGFYNATGATVNPTSSTWQFRVMK